MPGRANDQRFPIFGTEPCDRRGSARGSYVNHHFSRGDQLLDRIRSTGAFHREISLASGNFDDNFSESARGPMDKQPDPALLYDFLLR
jgi:hypothetical protein